VPVDKQANVIFIPSLYRAAQLLIVFTRIQMADATVNEVENVIYISYLMPKMPVRGIILHSSQQTARLSGMKAEISQTHTAASVDVPNQQYCILRKHYKYGASSAFAPSKREHKVSWV